MLRPMLCGTWIGQDPRGWWLSEKLNGARATWDGKYLWSRLGNRFIPPSHFTRGWPKTPIDGELWAGRGGYLAVMSAIKSPKNKTAWDGVKFVAFDIPAQALRVEDRIAALGQIKETNTISVLSHRICTGRAGLISELKNCYAGAAEGVVLRKSGSLYFPSSTNRDYCQEMLKVRVENNMSLVLPALVAA